MSNAEAEAAWEQRTEAKVAKAEDDLKEAWRALGFQTIFQRRALQGFLHQKLDLVSARPCYRS